MPESAPEDDKPVETTVSTVAPTEPTPKPDEAASAPSTEKPTGGTMLDAVKAALEPKAESPAAQTPEAKAAAEAPDATAKPEPEDGDLTPAELAALSQKTQKRFHTLTSNLKAKDEQIAGLQPKATELDNLNAYVRNAGLTNEQVAGTLELAALLRHDPRAALERMMPIVRQLEQIVGEALPPDLQERVRLGYLTEDDAKTLAKANAQARLSDQRANALTEQQRQRDALREQKEATDKTLSTVDEWEQAKAKSDPDWSSKRKEVSEQVELAILQETNRRGRPWFPNPQEAVKLSEDALTRVNGRYARFTPKPAAITPETGGASPRSTTSEPKTMLEAVRQGAARG